MATESKSGDPLVELRTFRLGDTDPAKDEEVQKRLQERFFGAYRVAVFGSLGAGKSSAIKSASGGRHYIPITDSFQSITLSAFLYDATDSLELLDLPGLEYPIQEAFKSARFESLVMQKNAGDMVAKEKHDRQAAVRKVLGLLRSGKLLPGEPISWMQGGVMDDVTFEVNKDPPGDSEAEVQSVLVVMTLGGKMGGILNPSDLIVHGAKMEDFSVKKENEYGDPTGLSQWCKMCFNLIQTASTVLKVPVGVLITRADMLKEHVTPDVDTLVAQCRGGRLRLLTKERVKWMQEYIERQIMPGAVFFTDLADPTAEEAQRSTAKALLHVMRAADRVEVQKMKKKIKEERGMGAGAGGR